MGNFFIFLIKSLDIRNKVRIFKYKKEDMKKFDIKETTDYLDEIGVNYTVNNNPTPEQLEKLRKGVEKRDLRIQQMVEDYHSGKYDELIKSIETGDGN